MVPPFLAACASGDLQKVKSIIQNEHPDITLNSEPLRKAVLGGHVEVARFLLDSGVEIWDTPLAIRHAGSKFNLLIQLFIESDWNVNQSFPDGDVLLPHVVQSEEQIRYLLSLGADPNLGCPANIWPRPDKLEADVNSGQALDYAAAGSTIQVIDLLLNHGAKIENSQALHAATESCRSDTEVIPIMEHMIELGCDVNALRPTYSGRTFDTPLSRAFRVQAIERARYLINHGADPRKESAGGKYGICPLDLAIRHQRQEFVDLFRGAS